MSVDGFIAGPGDAMDWIFDFMGPMEEEFPEIMAATGAMLIGRRTYEVGKRMAENPSEVTPSYDGGAVATALHAAGGKNLEIIGADVARQCLRRGLVDEILVYVLPVLLGDGTRFFSSPGLARIDLEPLDSTRSQAVTILRFRVRK